jgi:hypothetical protein
MTDMPTMRRCLRMEGLLGPLLWVSYRVHRRGRET